MVEYLLKVFCHVGFFRLYVTRVRGLMEESSENEVRLETHLQSRLGSRVRQLRVVCRNDGVVLYGSACTYHTKQLAQHFVMEITDLPIVANEIEVC